MFGQLLANLDRFHVVYFATQLARLYLSHAEVHVLTLRGVIKSHRLF